MNQSFKNYMQGKKVMQVFFVMELNEWVIEDNCLSLFLHFMFLSKQDFSFRSIYEVCEKAPIILGGISFYSSFHVFAKTGFQFISPMYE